MELNTASLGDFVKLADIMFMKGLLSVPQSMRTSGLVREVPIEANTGNSREFSEIDLEEYASRKDEGEQSERASVQQGYTKTMYQYRVAKDIGISYEMRTQNKYPEIVSRLTGLGRLAVNRMDLDLSHRITFGTATSFTDMDGVSVDIATGDDLALFYSAHTLRGSSATYRNRLANNPKLSQGAIEGMERLVVEETFNQFGEKMTMPFDILWTTDDPNTTNTAKQYLQSTADVDGANSGVMNVNSSKYRHVVLPRVATDANGAPDSTKRHYWGIASSLNANLTLGVWEDTRLKTPANLNAGEEFSTDDWNFGVRAGWGICTPGARWIKMSSGDGQA